MNRCASITCFKFLRTLQRLNVSKTKNWMYNRKDMMNIRRYIDMWGEP